MNAPFVECPRCGAKLPAGYSEEHCQMCWLEIGLENGTDFSLGNLAETLSNRSESSVISKAVQDHEQNGLQRYQDLQAIHDWSSGTVYRAFHKGLQRFVLLRMLESSADDEARRKFLRRAEKLAHLNHPHTATTLEAGVDRGAAYVSEEWLESRPVGGFLPRRRREQWAEGFFPNAELIRVMRDAASGLDAIHQTGLTHDRINPGCIVRDDSGSVRLIGLGQESESIDDRFAMPNNGRHQEFGEAGGPKATTTSATEATVAVDLFRLGASFCFLTTGKLPSELDPSLSYSTLLQRIKKTNPGLRSDVCRVLAKCLSQHELSTAADATSQVTVTDHTPEAIKTESSEHPYSDAAEIVDELSCLLLTGTRRAAWRPRIYSALLEALLLIVWAGMVQFLSYLLYGNGFGIGPLWLTTLPITLPIAYTVLFETIYGWTPVRRGFGIRLLDFSGEQGRLWRRAIRATAKIILFISLAIVPGIVGSLFSLTGIVLPMPFVMVCFVSWGIGFPMLLYASAMLNPSRWTIYDLVAGVTWGEQTRATASQVLDHTPATTRQWQFSSPTGNVDQYELYEPLGSGGMGHVFRGRDRVLGREVAIKLLSESLIENPLLLERFQREARLAAKVNHPGVAKVFGNGIWNRTPYIAMELVVGCNLQQRINEHGQLPVATAWNYILQATEALREANLCGVVHRDIKPANLMVTDEGILKVTDFGVSRSIRVDHEGEHQENASQMTTELGKTNVGTIVGTPAYMAPEQAMGMEIDCRCDIYALGMTMYHMLSGHAPFKANSVMEMLAQQISENPASLRGQVSELTHDQAGVLEKMIAKRPADRYASYDDLLHDLELHEPGRDHLATPLKRIAAENWNFVALLLLFSLGMSALSVWILEELGSESEYAKWSTVAMSVLLSSAVIGIYVIGVARQGRSSGKRMMGLRVVRGKR